VQPLLLVLVDLTSALDTITEKKIQVGRVGLQLAV
jgi:ABC-type transport system involved in Fe-S cluster assembly fused permease/ATPase subunit